MKKIFALAMALMFLLPVAAQAQFSGTDVSVTFRETDQTLPLGMYRFRLNDDTFSFQKNTAANGGFGTAATIFSFSPSSFTIVTAAAFSSTVSAATIGPNSGQQHTLPATTSDTVGLLAAAQTFSNKTISGSSNTLSNIANGSLTNSSLTVTAGTGMSGGGSVALGSSVTLTNAGVTSATGTSNQVIVSGSTGGVTFSLPQSINSTASPSFTKLTLGALSGTTGSIDFKGSTAGTLTTASANSTATYTFTYPPNPGTAGYVLRTDGSGGTTWVANGGGSAVTSAIGTSNQIAVSSATGDVTFSLVGPYTPATYTTNGILYGAGTSSIGVTAQGASGTVLHGNGGTPTFAAVSLTADVSGVLPLANGGTNANLSASNGGIFYSTASAAAITAGTSTAGQILRSGSLATPTWSTATYPATAGTANNVMVSDGTNFSTSPDLHLGSLIVDNMTTLGAVGATTASFTSTVNINSLLNMQEVVEVLNTKTGATGTVTHDFTTGAVWYHSSMSANFTLNLTNVPVVQNRALGITLILNQGGTGYIPNALQINGGSVSIKWQGGSAPTPSTSKFDAVTFSMIYTGSTWYALGQLVGYN